MVLIFNVYLTDSPGNPYVSLDRRLLKQHSKLDITKYSLCSLASMYKWTKVLVNIECDPAVYNQEQVNKLPEFVYSTFRDVDIVFSPTRIKYQKDWKNLYNSINSDFVFLLCNHDHIFLDSNNDYLEEMITEARKQIDRNPTIMMSHWPEIIRCAKSGYIELSEEYPRQLNKNYKHTTYGLCQDGVFVESLNIITKELYYNWFFTGDWGDITLPRADGLHGHTNLVALREQLNIPLPTQLAITPYKEQLRHFDGYMHQLISNNICPSLEIPTNFFESNIKIRYGYDDYKEGWVNINPKKENYRADNLDGADYKITMEDIPLFWNSRIIEIDVHPEINEEEMIQYRLHSVLKMVYSDDRYTPYIDAETEERVLNLYLKSYKNYIISNEAK
jgi:hypothetical protein